MYGLVNKGIEDLVRHHHGDATWERICAGAGVEPDLFLAMDSYPDEVTYRLVGAASRELGQPAAAILEAFGEHWVRYTAQAGYGALFKLSGSTFLDVLTNMDQLHARVAHGFRNFRMPSFVVEQVAPGRLTLRYRSHREGLAPMVVGLLRGLGAVYGERVAVTQVARREDVGEDVFDVEHGPTA